MFYKVITAGGLDTELVDKIVVQTVDVANTVFSYLFHDQHLDQPILPTDIDLTLFFYEGDYEPYPISHGSGQMKAYQDQISNFSYHEQSISINLPCALSFANVDFFGMDAAIDRIAGTIAYLIVRHYDLIVSIDLDDYYSACDDDY